MAPPTKPSKRTSLWLVASIAAIVAGAFLIGALRLLSDSEFLNYGGYSLAFSEDGLSSFIPIVPLGPGPVGSVQASPRPRSQPPVSRASVTMTWSRPRAQSATGL